MADKDWLDALNNCLERLNAGQSVTDCLREYPQHADRLRDLLITADLVQRAQQAASAPMADEKAAVRQRVEWSLRQREQIHRQQLWRRRIRVGGGLAAALVVLVGGAIIFLAIMGPPVGNIFSHLVSNYAPGASSNAADGLTSPAPEVAGLPTLAPLSIIIPENTPLAPVATSVARMSPVPSQTLAGASVGLTMTPTAMMTATRPPLQATILPTAGLMQSPLLTASPTPLPPSLSVDVIPLSAGEINDNVRWDSYLLYRQNFLRDYAPFVHDVDVTGRQIITVADTRGLPVPGARVQVYHEQTLVSETRTMANGQTLFFPNARPASRGATSFRVIVSQENAAVQFMLDINRGAAWDVTLPPAGNQAQTRLDVLFLLDTTGSMGDELAQLQNNILGISAQIDALRVDARYGLVTYRDRGDAYVTRLYDFTPDVAVFQASLRGERADGGGDEPESLNEALHNAVQTISWRDDDTVKLVFLVADAPPHLDYPQDYDYAQEMLIATQRGIKIHPIASSSLSPIGEYIFRQIAQTTLGHFIFLTYQQGVPGAPGEARPDLHVGEAANPATGQQGDYTVERLDELVLRLITDELAALTTPVERQGIAAPVTSIPAGSLPPDAPLGLGLSEDTGAAVHQPPPTPAPTDSAALPVTAITPQTQIGLPLVVVLVGMGLYVGFILRPRPPRKRKNDER